MAHNMGNVSNDVSVGTDRYLCNLTRTELTKSWFLTRSIWPSISFVMTYWVFVFVIGPWFMKNRKPYNLRLIILAFNLYQFVANTYMWVRFLSINGGVTFLWENSCHPADQVDSRLCREEVFMIWFYYTTKVTDLLDTVFFILKKKQSQVTFLHIYHHSIMVLASWYFGLLLSGSQIIIIGGINTIIHSVMYAYYFLSAIGASMQKYLWWKIYITQMQMVQFVIIIAYMSYLIKNQCSLPPITTYIIIFRECFFLILFLNFYIRSYKKSKMAKELIKSSQKQDLKATKEN